MAEEVAIVDFTLFDSFIFDNFLVHVCQKLLLLFKKYLHFIGREFAACRLPLAHLLSLLPDPLFQDF